MSSPPNLYQLHRVSTEDFDPSIRFEAWRASAYYTVDLLPPEQGELSGVAQFVRGAGGAFGTHQASKHATQFSRKSRREGLGDCMVVSLMAQGEVCLDSPDGGELTVAEGTLALYDAARPMRYRWSDGKDVYLLLPRQTLIRTLGSSLPALSLPLDSHPMAPMLRSQMLMLSQQADLLAPHELAAMLDASIEMAMLLLSGLASRHSQPEQYFPAGLYASTVRYLEMNFHRADLHIDTIVNELRCSRATLYRAFAEHGVGVMDSLRELRLDQVRSKIDHAPYANIGALAADCGLPDPSAFGKMFKARFGMSPRDWRARSDRSPSQ